MNRIYFALLAVAFGISSCASEKITVRSNDDFLLKNTDNHTFALVKDINFPENSNFDENVILDEIGNQMSYRGFKQVSQNADIVISYSVFDRNCKMADIRKISVGSSSPQERSEMHRLALKNGTLVIQMIDRRTQKPFWMGYATELFGKRHRLEDRVLRSATRSIFDNYKATANGYVAIR
ncbi:DUF4136 domain-containing protein [Pseudarcicella hirudinis]|nr:DUF4136 domain-containing protein [Pseudarcicella hirudinis]